MAVPYAFAIWARQRDRRQLRCREAPPRAPFDGTGWAQYGGIGFGVDRESAPALPHMRSATFRGEFPLPGCDWRIPPCLCA